MSRKFLFINFFLFTFLWLLVYAFKSDSFSNTLVQYPDFSFYYDYAYNVVTSFGITTPSFSTEIYSGDLRSQWTPSPLYTLLISIALVLSGSTFLYHFLGYIIGLSFVYLNFKIFILLAEGLPPFRNLHYSLLLLNLSPVLVVQSIYFSSDLVAGLIISLFFFSLLSFNSRANFDYKSFLILFILLLLLTLLRPNGILFLFSIFVSYLLSSSRISRLSFVVSLLLFICFLLVSRSVFGGYPNGGILYFFWPNSWISPAYLLDQTSSLLTLNPFSPSFTTSFSDFSFYSFLRQLFIVPFLSFYKALNLMGMPTPLFSNASIFHLTFYLYRFFYSIILIIPLSIFLIPYLFTRSSIYKFFVISYLVYVIIQSFFVGGDRYMLGTFVVPFVFGSFSFFQLKLSATSSR